MVVAWASGAGVWGRGEDHPFEKRQAEAARIREKYPDRIPVICEKEPRSDIPPVDKRKYLIPMDLTVGQFVYVIRKRISIPPEKAIFIFVNNTLPPTAALMSTVYENHRDPDGFMYMMYGGENTFGELELRPLSEVMKAVRVPRGTYFKHAVGTTGLDERQRGAIMSYNASLTQCPQRSCGNYLEDGHVGAHVQIEGHSGMWIIPTCKDCNTEAKNIADVNVYNTNEWVDLTQGDSEY
ncbi:hypothetical protein EMIHUDRAFT_118718 [Emiliania huxleyi CCMP1516]|uniref:Autophagy-related protein n=2 Tax=Emiliania huxleyi TaxID=2903 RepID=A0A0D3J0T4_EMIH1|nr:hypothetical protein EMIHUDRAFT_118718 [Emiliania huxleyi CCMP1516]EOD17119.1 hypothetical protein EMIHUDRAFT_118718 [Emiliania huxleyi CCMP1516]|eukprot:XP_005769548.1 hypothetical protein EMIHUDRAFT_118718 [Emiliania huxleyi CCMP1516]